MRNLVSKKYFPIQLVAATPWQQDLSKHVRKYHSGEEPKHECTHEGCGKRFYERKLLVAHARIHSDERPFACTVPGCDKRFRARNALVGL